jgi:peroxiredoxin
VLALILGGLALGGAMAYFTIVMGASNPLASTALGQLAPAPDTVSVDKAAPDFAAQTPDGKMVRLSDLRGSIVALNFWATWCGPCRVEMPELDDAARRYSKDKLVILGVDAGEDVAQVQNYFKQLNLGFQTVLDPNGTVVDLYEIKAFPTTIWIDAKGVVRAKHLGPLTRDFIDRYVADLASR